MVGLHTLESPSPSSTYQALSPLIGETPDGVSCYSRLPARQLLRHVPSNKANMWWMSDHDSPQSIPPHPADFIDHVRQQSPVTTELIILEGLDWFVARSSESDVLSMLQELDTLSRTFDFDLILPVDALSFSKQFWARLTSIAPKMEVETSSFDESILVSEDRQDEVEGPEGGMEDDDSKEPMLVHLVQLPKAGFTHSLLAKRMLQWKRMGFDLSALEPALVLSDLNESHAIYSGVESDIICAIDCIRLLEANRAKLTITEREMYNYRMMSLNNVREAARDLETILSSR